MASPSPQVDALVFKLRKELARAVVKHRPGYGYLIEAQSILA